MSLEDPGLRMTTRPATPEEDRKDFLVEVACLRHEYHLNQEAIARRFGVSRSTISRALSEAERLGLVQVMVTEPMPREARLAEAIRDRYGVTTYVGMRLTGEPSQAAAARVMARVLERIAVGGNLTIAASWGRTLAQAAHLVRPRHSSGIAVVDAIGHAVGDQMAPAIEVTRTLATAFAATAVHLPSPAFADSEASLEFLLASPPVARVLQAARDAEVSLVSVGVVGDDSLLTQAGVVSPQVMRALVQRGAVGEILGRYYDRAGTVIEAPPLLPVGLSLDDLRASRRVIAAAGGARKADAVRAALAGGIVDELVVDDALAEALVRPPEG